MGQVTNNSRSVRVINAKDGDRIKPVSIAPGQTKEVDAIETPVFLACVDAGILTVKAEPKTKAKETSETGAYVITDKGSGWFVVSLDGKAVTKSLRESVVDGFYDLDDEGKAAFVEAHKAD